MYLTHCMMEWIVLLVLSLCPAVWSAVKVIQPYKVVSVNGTAQVNCFVLPQPPYHQVQPPADESVPYPYLSPMEIRVTVLKGLYGTQEFCSSILNLTEQTDAAVQKEEKCSAQLGGGAVEVTMFGLKATDTDIYRCEIEVFCPPPYLRFTGNGTLIHVLGSSDYPVQKAQRQMTHQGDEEEDDEEKKAPISVALFILAMVVMFVLLVIVALKMLQCEREKREAARPVAGILHTVDAASFSCKTIA